MTVSREDLLRCLREAKEPLVAAVNNAARTRRAARPVRVVRRIRNADGEIEEQIEEVEEEPVETDSDETVGVGDTVVIQPDQEITGEIVEVVEEEPADEMVEDSVELFVAVENALLGKSINHKAFKGEVTPVYRPVSGDRYLARAVARNYAEGDALYLTQTTNGIYFTKTTGEGTGSEVKAYAAESFVIPAATNTALTPPFFYDVVDDSTTERPSSTRMNGGVVNLLRVRFA